LIAFGAVRETGRPFSIQLAAFSIRIIAKLRPNHGQSLGTTFEKRLGEKPKSRNHAGELEEGV